ncbi:MAG TPA: hypothetical protein VG454_04385 [Gemmatimonadales bacterium]|nr:hypothetical protein [Gemmatimonadales bacterium]
MRVTTAIALGCLLGGVAPLAAQQPVPASPGAAVQAPLASPASGAAVPGQASQSQAGPRLQPEMPSYEPPAFAHHDAAAAAAGTTTITISTVALIIIAVLLILLLT